MNPFGGNHPCPSHSQSIFLYLSLSPSLYPVQHAPLFIQLIPEDDGNNKQINMDPPVPPPPAGEMRAFFYVFHLIFWRTEPKEGSK